MITSTNLSAAVPAAKALEKTTDPESKEEIEAVEQKWVQLKAKLGQSGKRTVLIEFAPRVNKEKENKSKVWRDLEISPQHFIYIAC